MFICFRDNWNRRGCGNGHRRTTLLLTRLGSRSSLSRLFSLSLLGGCGSFFLLHHHFVSLLLACHFCRKGGSLGGGRLGRGNLTGLFCPSLSGSKFILHLELSGMLLRRRFLGSLFGRQFTGLRFLLGDHFTGATRRCRLFLGA